MQVNGAGRAGRFGENEQGLLIKTRACFGAVPEKLIRLGGRIPTTEGQQSPECSFSAFAHPGNILHFSAHKPVMRWPFHREERLFYCA